MTDLPPVRLHLIRPSLCSIKMACFGSKWGSGTERRWDIIFKCLTIMWVHLGILQNLDSDSFLMAVTRFIALRGTPFKLLSDQGTNFCAGVRAQIGIPEYVWYNETAVSQATHPLSIQPSQCTAFWRSLGVVDENGHGFPQRNSWLPVCDGVWACTLRCGRQIDKTVSNCAYVPDAWTLQ